LIDMPPSEIQHLLENSRIGRLGMVDAGGRPYTIPLRFVWTAAALYVRLAHEGRKGDALDHDNRVCFETDTCAPDFSYYASVVLEGTLIDATDDDEKRAALVAYNDKYSRLCGLPNPGPNPTTKGVAIRKLLIESTTGRKNEPPPSAALLRPRPAFRRPLKYPSAKTK
jgi:uncharacterized protein